MWWRDTDRDFSVARHDTGGLDLREFGFEFGGHFNERLAFMLRASQVERGTTEDEQWSVLLDYQATAKNRVRFEVQEDRNEDRFLGTDRQETVAAIELAHAFSERFEVFGGYQTTIEESGLVGSNNDMVFAGTRNRVTDRLRLATEFTAGHRGDGAGDCDRRDLGEETHSDGCVRYESTPEGCAQ